MTRAAFLAFGFYHRHLRSLPRLAGSIIAPALRGTRENVSSWSNPVLHRFPRLSDLKGENALGAPRWYTRMPDVIGAEYHSGINLL
jgi:hypothetical protein